MILKGFLVIFCLVCINLFARYSLTLYKTKGFSPKDLLKISFTFSVLLTTQTLAMLAIGTEFSSLIHSAGLFIIYWSNIYGLLKVCGRAHEKN